MATALNITYVIITTWIVERTERKIRGQTTENENENDNPAGREGQRNKLPMTIGSYPEKHPHPFLATGLLTLSCTFFQRKQTWPHGCVHMHMLTSKCSMCSFLPVQNVQNKKWTVLRFVCFVYFVETDYRPLRLCFTTGHENSDHCLKLRLPVRRFL